jgi:outer membrane protein assembly factor BamB
LHFATLSGKTYALRATDGKLVWRKPMGKYSPVIATEKTYFFALNGRLLAYAGRNSPPPAS